MVTCGTVKQLPIDRRFAGAARPLRSRVQSAAAMFVVAAGVAIVLLGMPSGRAGAQSLGGDPAALLNRIDFLERQVRYLSERLNDSRQAPEARGVKEPPAVEPTTEAAGASAGGAATARLAVRIGDLEHDIRDVTGRMEDMAFQVRRLNERLDKLSTDLEYRLSQRASGETGSAPAAAAARAEPAPAASGSGRPPPAQTGPVVLGAVPNQSEPPPARAIEAPPPPVVAPPAPVSPPAAVSPPAPASAAQAATPREVYAGAFAQLQKEKYEEAETGFQQFLKRYPDDPLAENANYWLGEARYARGDYARAATTFLEGYEKHKKGAKAADTLLKLAMSLGQLNKKPEACATLQELARAFPGAPSAIKSKAGEERRRIACS